MESKRTVVTLMVNPFAMEINQNARLALDDQKPKSKKLLENTEPEYGERKMETLIVEDLILPQIFIMKYALPFVDTIKYDPIQVKCILEKGSLRRKILCTIWGVAVLYKLIIVIIPGLAYSPSSADGNSEGGISKLKQGAFIVFTTYTILNFSTYWNQTARICEIFNNIIGLGRKLYLKQASPSRMKTVMCGAHISWSFALSYVLLTFALFIANCLISNQNLHEGAHHQMDIGNLNKSANLKLDLDFNEINTNEGTFILIRIVTGFASFANIFNWMMSYFHLGMWSLIFRQIFVIFYWRIETLGELEHAFVIPNEVRTFNRISCIIDQFNQVYGYCFLVGAVVFIVYVAPTLKHVVPGFQNLLSMSSGLHLLLSYVPMITVAFLAAEVQRMAGKFASVIKEQYDKLTKSCDDKSESLFGIAIVHFDLATANIGIKGTGFFTVSYQFITTIASLIVTYSILVIQLFPQDKADGFGK